MGTASLHASIIEGGRELSSYPDRCGLKLERRTVTGETDASVLAELDRFSRDCRRRIPSSRRRSTPLFARPSYEIPAGHELPVTLQRVLTALPGSGASRRVLARRASSAAARRASEASELRWE